MCTFSVLSDRGVSVSVANCYHPQRLTELEEEGVGIDHALATIGGQPIIISACYCSPDPNSTNGLSKLLLNIQKAWRFCQNSGIKGLAILGDFNARSRQWSDRLQNPRGKLLSELVLKHGCSITAPPGNTFVSSNGGSISDLCLVYGSTTTALGRSWVDDNNTHELFTGAPNRGHLLVIQHFIHSAPSSTVPKRTRFVFNYDYATWVEWSSYIGASLGNFLEQIVQENLNHSSTELYEFFFKTVTSTSEICIPSKQVCMHSKPYWSENLSQLSIILRKAKDMYHFESTITNKVVFNKAKEDFKTALIKERNDWIHKKLKKLNTKESMIFWKQYQRIFLSDDNENQSLCLSDTMLSSNPETVFYCYMIST